MWRWVTPAASFPLSKEKGKINIEPYQLHYQPFILLLSELSEAQLANSEVYLKNILDFQEINLNLARGFIV